jgi:YidC/Oxa1 family membrane protein insertase
MPVFFAFYQVLGEAIELVGAPYIFWIKDLSHKDPFFVLPILMTAAMWLQQKYTPTTTTDPTQKKIMMFMPLIFGFIMKDLPSGLVLYIFVSTLFGILQQLWVYKTTPG